MFSVRSNSPLRPPHWIGILLLIAIGDYLTGPFIHSVLLFYLIPVVLAAWSSRSWWPGLAVALVWPFLRLGIVALWGWPWPTWLTLEDTIVNGIVSGGLAILVWQVRRQMRAIRTLEGMLPMCGFCKRIRTGNDWVRVDAYILDHSEAVITHTFCPECGRAHYGHLFENPLTPSGPPDPPHQTSQPPGAATPS